MTKQESYQQKKARVIRQMKATSGSGVALNKSTSNLFRATKNQTQQKLDVKDFNQVISINPAEGYFEAEGMITFESLVDALLPHGFVPPVAPELKSITLGGAIAGIGVESSCFRYGFVHETVEELDVLTGTGEVITCSPTQNSDLFFAIPNSYGTLGYVLRIKQKMVPAKPYVAINRQRFSDYSKYVDAIAAASGSDSYDYIDGLVFKPDEMYLMLGKFADEAPFVSDYTYLEIYYKSMDKKEDYLTTKDYIFRYDTDWFWTTRAFGLENKFLRRLWGKKRLRSDVYYKLLRWERKFKTMSTLQKLFGQRHETLIQDAEVLVKDAPDFLAWFHQNITDRRPLTIGAVIPYHKDRHYTLFPMNPNEVYLNIGYYAAVPSTHPLGHYNKLFEKKLMQLKAKKMMYSESYYTREEFWNIFDQAGYSAVKNKYDPTGRFPGLYERLVLKK